MISIFNYSDYRTYLNDVLDEKKRLNPNFSFRFIARNLGLRSSAFFNLVLNGKRKLSEKLAYKVALLFKLSDQEREYFIYMLNYTNAANQTEKKFYFERMIAFRERQSTVIDSGQYQIYKKWYYSVILELLHAPPAGLKIEQLGKKLIPPISPGQTLDAVNVLLKTGYLRKKGDGTLEPVQPTLTSGTQWQSEVIHHWQRSISELGQQALNSVPKEERDISNIIVGVSPETLQLMKEEIRQLRERFLALSEKDTAKDRIYICNLQLFPATRILPEE